ncbi:PglL family O-oligosaccharyltransferase [Motilimonas cestriensis]|uniref:PglL family O-oligosaccharyltransferase n=1 Tax=Motilimonas cestriensis TaxID=2742685 RepID=A0ABS8W6V7_9GAMM|nr:PglL family O-oligosaccharyltransferase [Motilimonas cestriensis]MCE2594283.1 PglL family O-oligosaccharyltransferase [Motilimonas cestriensis]
MDQSRSRLNITFTVVFALFCLIGMHYFQHNQGGAGLDLPMNPVAWCFISILIGLGLWQISIAQTIRYDLMSMAGFIAFALLVIPVFYPNGFFADASYGRLFGFIGGILLLFAMQQLNLSKQNWLLLLFLIVCAGFIQNIYSLTQMYLLKPGNILGFDVNYGRPYGIFQQPNVLASFTATSLLLSCYLVQKLPPKGRPALTAFLLAQCFLSAWVIYISASRTGYLGAVIGLVLIAPWLLQQSKKRFSWVIIAIALGLSTHFIISDGSVSRNKEELAKAGARALQYEQSWHMMLEKPLTGWGYGNFENSFLTNRAERIQAEGVPFVLENLTHPHNELMYWGVEGGIVPLLGLLILAITFIYLLSRFQWRKALAFLALVFPLTLHSQTEYPFYHAAATWFIFIVLVAYISHKGRLQKEIIFRPYLLVKCNAILIPLLTCAFMITAVQTNYLVTKFERSGRTDIDLLMQVVNPLALTTRLEFNIFTLRMLVGEKLNKPEELEAYVTWASEFVKHTPRANIYYNLAYAYRLLNQEQKSQAVIEYARFLYPNNELLKTDLAEVMRDVEKAPSEVVEMLGTVSKAEPVIN